MVPHGPLWDERRWARVPSVAVSSRCRPAPAGYGPDPPATEITYGSPHALTCFVEAVRSPRHEEGIISPIQSSLPVRAKGPQPDVVARVKKTKERSCEGFLSEEEFRRIGRLLDEVEAEGKISASAVAAIRPLMLTGCRRGEIMNLRWEDVYLEAGKIRLCESKTGAFFPPVPVGCLQYQTVSN